MDASQITTNSTGNIKAGDIKLSFGPTLGLANRSFINTANSGDGGDIDIQGGGTITLADSGIQTTVRGGKGNGGDIAVKADTLFMNTGLIQANAKSGNGGAITLNVNILIPSGNSLNGIEFGSADPFAVRLAPGA